MRLLFLAALMLLATACAPAISRQSLELVDPELTFETMARDPDRHVGRYLLLGGAIISSRTLADDGSELEIIQMPVNDRGKITDVDRSAGRFIVQDKAFRDPAVYRPGRLVTMVGQVTGSRKGRIGERDYLYPVVSVQEIHLWSPADHPDASRLHFGIGIGVGITN